MASALTALIKDYPQDSITELDEKKIKAFEDLKTILMNANVLHFLRYGLPSSVDTNACLYQGGCALIQTHKYGHCIPSDNEVDP